MTELFQSLGLNQNPFSKFSAEEELEYLKEIYVTPKYFNSLFSDLKSGSSRFIIGSRGSGKTALMHQLKDILETSKVFVLFIDNFDGMPTKENEKHFLYNLIQKLVTDYCLVISQNPKLLKKLNEFEKEKLSFFIEQFFKTLSRKEYEDRYNKVTSFKTKNFFKNLYNNYFNKPINFLISGGVEIIADTVSKSFSLPSVKTDDFFKNYVPTIPVTTPKKNSAIDSYDYNSLKEILIDLTAIIKKTDYDNVVILFDKIDEYRELKGSINDVCIFIESILKDTNLLMQNNFSLVFSIWDEVRNELASSGIRFDKFKPIDVTWTTDEISKILNNRIKFFGENSKSADSLLEDSSELMKLIDLSNTSPRDLLHLFGAIYDEQTLIDINSRFLSNQSINKGKMKFCKEYEYYALFPSKRNSKEDVFRNINRLLKTGKVVLRATDFVTSLKVSTPTANSYIKIIQDFNFTKMTDQQYVYEISDPKLKFLIEKGVNEI
jgi:energy-coupling factor transporter ATP-binding protein EcfA2